MRLEGATRAAIIAAVLVGCSSFRANDAPSDPSMNDGGADAGSDSQDGSSSSVGQQPVAPAAPSAVTAKAVTVVTTVTTLAGSGTAAFADGTGAAASFNAPSDVEVDAAGNLYVTDTLNQRIRKVTASGVVTTVAGSGTAAYADGTGASASFSSPAALALDPAGNLIVCDANNARIRKVTQTGVVTTLAGSGSMTWADGPGTAASFIGPAAIAVNSAGVIYIGDISDNRIRQITPTGVVTTLAGSGTGAFSDGISYNASFRQPWGLALDGAGKLYVADFTNNRIRVVTPTGVVTTLAGSGTTGDLADGTGSAASFSGPRGIVADERGNIFVADEFNNRLRRIAPGAVVTTLAGSDASAFADGIDGAASFNGPNGIALNAGGVLYVADGGNNRIRKVTIVGIGQLAVTWSAPSTADSALAGYTASATAAGQPSKSCAVTGMTSCTIDGLTTGARYTVSVTATNSAGTSPPSAAATATPN